MEILNGTYTLDTLREASEAQTEQEVVSAEITMTANGTEQSATLEEINAALEKVGAELDRYTSKADKADYALAVSRGIRLPHGRTF